MSSVPRPYKYFDVLMAGFVTSLLVTGTVASNRLLKKSKNGIDNMS